MGWSGFEQVRADVDGKLVAEDVIPNRESLLVYSRRGYIKRMQTDLFAAQACGPFTQHVMFFIVLCSSTFLSPCPHAPSSLHRLMALLHNM